MQIASIDVKLDLRHRKEGARKVSTISTAVQTNEKEKTKAKELAETVEEEKFCSRRWGSLLPGLRMLDTPLGPNGYARKFSSTRVCLYYKELSLSSIK